MRTRGVREREGETGREIFRERFRYKERGKEEGVGGSGEEMEIERRRERD